MIFHVSELKENTVDELLNVLGNYRNRSLSIMGSCSSIYIHVTEDCVILDDVNLNEE